MMMGETLKQFEAYQKCDYSKQLSPKPVLQRYLTHLHVLSEEEIEQRSFEMEPLPENGDSLDRFKEEKEEDFSFISEYSESMVSEESECHFFTDDDEPPQREILVWGRK